MDAPIRRRFEADEARISALESTVGRGLPTLSGTMNAAFVGLSGSVSSSLSALSGSVAHGRWLGRQIITATGQYTPTAGTYSVNVEMVAGGGGGGGAVGSAGQAAGAGGASGVYVRLHGLLIGAAGTGSCTIGTAGAGGSSAGGDGTDGTDTVLQLNGGIYTAKGGPHGGGMTTTTAPAFAFPGQYSAAGSTLGDIGPLQEGGQPGISAVTNLFWGGSGGSNPLGTGGVGANGTNAGGTPRGYGAGGGGASANTPGQAGGRGGYGVIIFEEFS